MERLRESMALRDEQLELKEEQLQLQQQELARQNTGVIGGDTELQEAGRTRASVPFHLLQRVYTHVVMFFRKQLPNWKKRWPPRTTRLRKRWKSTRI